MDRLLGDEDLARATTLETLARHLHQRHLARRVTGGSVGTDRTAAQIADDCRAYGAAGVRTIVISFESDDIVESLSRIDEFADQVMPLVR